MDHCESVKVQLKVTQTIRWYILQLIAVIHSLNLLAGESLTLVI